MVQTLVLGWLHDPRAPVDGLVEVPVAALSEAYEGNLTSMLGET